MIYNRECMFLAGAALLLMAGSFAPAADSIAVRDGQKIAFLGDSITAKGVEEPIGYVNLVMRGLAINGIKTTAIPAGVCGDRSNQMLERLERDVLAKKPDWMTLSCGVNDSRGLPLEQYRQNITEIVERCQKAGVSVMILTATVIGEDTDNPENQKLAS